MRDGAEEVLQPLHSRAVSLASFLVKYRLALLALTASLVVAALFGTHQPPFDYRIESLFADKDPDLQAYTRFKTIFGNEEAVLAAYSEPDAFTPAGLKRLKERVAQFERIPGVQGTLSPLSTPLGEKLVNSPLQDRFLPIFDGMVLGADRQTVGVVCLIQPNSSDGLTREQTVRALFQAVEQQQPPGVLAGEPVILVEGVRYVQEDGKQMHLLSLAVLALVIGAYFRSVRWVVLALMIAEAVRLLTQAALTALDVHQTLMSPTVGALVAVGTMTSVVYIALRFTVLQRTGWSARAALERTIGELAGPIFWSCSTSALGFAALCLTAVRPVREFGITMACASLFVGVVLATSLPGLLLLFSADRAAPPLRTEPWLERSMRRLLRAVVARPALSCLLLLLALFVAAVGYRNLEVETDMMRNFHERSRLIRGYDIVEAKLGGAGAWDVFFPAPEPLTWQFLDRVTLLEERLRKEVTVPVQGGTTAGLTKVVGIKDIFETVLPPYFSRRLAPQTLLDLAKKENPKMVSSFYGQEPSTGRRFLRLMLRARFRQPLVNKDSVIEQVTTISREVFPEATVTGPFIMQTHALERMAAERWKTFAAAALAVGFLMLIALRNPLVATLALAANALPIVAVGGLTGWIGWKINMGTVMVASVSMGLAINASLHFGAAIQRHFRAGLPLDRALETAHTEVSTGVTLASLALIVGFSALSLSEYQPTMAFGTFVGISLLATLLVNLVVLPVLLRRLLPSPR